jgi:hypothetical protein
MDAFQSLFAQRVPEAAARQLAVVLAWATECELATLEELKEIKSSSKRSIERHQLICNKLLTHCHELGVPAIGLDGRRCQRLEEALQQLKANLP